VDLDAPEPIPQGMPSVCAMRLPGRPGWEVPLIAAGVDWRDGEFVLEALVPDGLKDEMRAEGSDGVLLIYAPPLPRGVKVKVV
jgi:hypothetical protein